MLYSLFVSLAFLFSLGSSEELLGLPQINPSSWDATLAQGNTVVYMANPVCPRCKKIVPELANLKAAFPEGSGVNLVAINCAQNTFFCHNTHRVGGYPGIKYFTKDGPELGTFYEGPKKYGDMRKMIESELGATASASAPAPEVDASTKKSFFNDMKSTPKKEADTGASSGEPKVSDPSTRSGPRGFDYNGIGLPNQVIFGIAILVVAGVWTVINKLVAAQRKRDSAKAQKDLVQAEKRSKKKLKRGNSKKKQK